MKVSIHPATTDDLAFVGRRLRSADCRELGLQPGDDATHVLLEAANDARWCNVARIDGEPAVVYGVNPLADNPRWGAPWLLATADSRRLRREFVTHSRAEVDLMLAGFPFLTNAVHDRHEDAIRWLIWLGFTIEFTRPQRRGAQTFLPFWKGNPHV